MKIFDLHCDSLYKFVEKGREYSFLENDGHISLQNLLKGGYIAQCFAVYTPCDLKGEQAYSFLKEQYKRFLKLKDSLGKISAIFTVENAEFLNGRLQRITEIEKMGVRILGLVHNAENCIGFPHSKQGGLKDFGKEVVDAVNSTKMLIDVSHLNLYGFFDVAKISKKPFVATHSACRTLQGHTRNLTDQQIKIIANSGGIVGIPFYSAFLNGGNKTEIEDIIRHIKHLIEVGGEDIAAIGTDFDGMECEMFLKNAAEMQILADALIKKFSFGVAEKVCYKNALRVL